MNRHHLKPIPLFEDLRDDLCEEMISLNLDDLAVEELERRLELAAAMPAHGTHGHGCKIDSQQ